MKVFELHFNPKGEEDTVFDSFCYEPINIEEKRLGNLYMAGEIKNTLPQNYNLLEKLAFEIKKEYYRDSKRSPEKSLIESLRIGNKFLENLTKEGNVSWLGNLNFAVFCLKPHTMSPGILRGKDSDFHFTKVENISTFLLRGGKITDIAQKLMQEEIEPYPLKVFGNIVSGKLVENDIILILTKEVSATFNQGNLLNEIANFPAFNEKKLKESLEKREKVLKETSGIAVLLALTKEESTFKERIPELLEYQKIKERFSMVGALSPVKDVIFFSLNFWPKIFKKIFYRIKGHLSFRIPALPKIKLPVLNFGLIERKQRFFKNLILILFFTLILISGFYLFQFQEKKEIAKLENQFAKIQLTVRDAEKFLILAKEGESRTLFLEAWKEIESLEKILPEGKTASNLRSEIPSLKEKIESSLLKLNNLIEIEEPEILFDFSQKTSNVQAQFTPQKMVILGERLYFFNPISQNLFFVDINKKSGEEIQTDKKFNFAQPFTADSIIFFAKPDSICEFLSSSGEFSENKIQFSGEFDFIDFKNFYSTLYLLDKEKGEIFKCSLQNCELWLSKNSSKKPLASVSFAVDGSIWILEKNGNLDRYWAGLYQETLAPAIFPELEKPTKISAPAGLGTNSYFFILEPTKNRILIMTKSGEIYKQFQSEKFDNLKDFSVSADGKTIYLLNGLILYQIKF
jgi:hypothetical protein